jgi:hypothetical protein
MARFELSLKESFRHNQRHWPEEFHNVCQGLAMAIAHVARSRKFDIKAMPRFRAEVLARLASPTIISAPAWRVIRPRFVAAHGELMAAFWLKNQRDVITGTIPVADDAAERFQTAFTAIPDVVSIRRVE